MATRIANVAPVGSLLERGRRKLEPKYLAAIRHLPCLICRMTPCREAAHVRMSSGTGMGQKPDDRRAVPMCHRDHMEQHTMGERQFWAQAGIDIEAVIIELNRAYPDLELMETIVRQNAG